VLAAMEETRST
jgi:hypothetical protein